MDETFDPMLGYVKSHPYYKDILVSSLGMVRIFDPGRKEFVWTYGKKDEKRGRLIWALGHSGLRICRLVAETFIPNSDRLPLVLHKDHNLDNNTVENLCWGTHYDCQRRSLRKYPVKRPFIIDKVNIGNTLLRKCGKIPINTYPDDVGDVRCHPVLKYIGVSSNGYVRIYNEKTKQFRFTKGKGSSKLGKMISYKGRLYKVCRLIAETFLPNPLNKPLVIHRDNDPLNNRLDNLFWGDYRDMQYNSKKNKPTYEKLGVDPYDRKAARKAQHKIWKSNHPRLQFAGHVWHHVTQEEFNLLRPVPWYERPVPERYRK